MGKTLSVLITFVHVPVPHTIRYLKCTGAPSTAEAQLHAQTVADWLTHTMCATIQRATSAHDSKTSMTGKLFLLYLKLHPCGGSVPQKHWTVQGEKSRRDTCILPPQKTKFPTKEDFPLLGNTHPSTSAWSSGVIGAGVTTSQNTERKALREELGPFHALPAQPQRTCRDPYRTQAGDK
ncbi:hypothetical protein HPB51_004369 [Rhipicephalus microplus]|uniref:Uncharacterized protein n=1 Tax=Rhipicephalus microplus TaxID=6941 RepID=A0A9J6EM50_RHIMP|nr:hypothetical protein HPB51_004369 [Rhipicephalus microplus]